MKGYSTAHAGMMAIILLVIITACSESAVGAEKTSGRSPSAYRALIADVSFASEIDQCNFATMLTPIEQLDGFSEIYVSKVHGSIGTAIPDRELTQREQLRLGIWSFDDGTSTIWPMTLRAVRHYYHEHGEFPESGIDLFPELLTESGFSDFANLDKTDALRKYRDGIDPITGRFYSSFTAANWQAGAMNISVIDDAAEISEQFPNRRVWLTERREDGSYVDVGTEMPSEVWFVTVYGEEQGTVLYDGINFQ